MSDKKGPLTFIAALAAGWPPDAWRDVTVLVAVSGGADSTALARGLSQLSVTGEGRLVIAHFNHALRGAESDADQALVEDLARELGTECVLGAQARGREGEGEKGPSEESLRNVRYEFLANIADRVGARYVVTAHTADDQVETVLMNILRGTGLAGLAGIPRMRQLTEGATLIRPLLAVTRADVLAYLGPLDKPFREDATNASTAYTRNRVRHELLPLLTRDFNPQIREALLRLARLAGEADEVVASSLGHELAKLAHHIDNGIEIDRDSLCHAKDIVARSILIEAWKRQGWPLADMNFDRWDELLAFARESFTVRESTIAPQMFPGGVRAERTQSVLRLVRLQP